MCRTHDRRGQGLTEYVIAVILVAVGVLAAVKLFGWRVEERYFEGSIEVEAADAR